MIESTSKAWQVSRRFLGEITAAFIANFPIMLHDHEHKYAPFVGSLIAASAVYCSIFVTFVISGAQINPMTSLMVVLSRRMSILLMPFYFAAQLIGTTLALEFGRSISPFVANRSKLGMAMPGPEISDFQAISVEIVITFLLELSICSLLDELRLPSFHHANKFNAFILLVADFFWIDSIAVRLSLIST